MWETISGDIWWIYQRAPAWCGGYVYRYIEVNQETFQTTVAIRYDGGPWWTQHRQ